MFKNNKSMKKNVLPPADCLLYDSVHEYVENTSKETSYGKRIIEHKIFFIIDALSLYIYGMPMSNTTYTAMHGGPVERKIYEIQKNRKKITQNPQNITDRELSFYKKIADVLFESVKEAFEKDILEYNSSFLSDITHTPEWKKKYDQWFKVKNTQKAYTVGEMSKKDILRFAIDVLEKKYKGIIDLAKEKVASI